MLHRNSAILACCILTGKPTIFPGGTLQLVRRYRIPALFCAVAVVVCELISRPYADTGICDDGPYILVAQTLAATGHIVFNGWSAAMLTWQLYLGAALIKVFGFSFTTVRLSTLPVAAALAFFLQRTLARAGINERNATIGTLALVLSPLYLALSGTFMSDIHGLFAVLLCLYGCLRALQSSTIRGPIGWLCFAVVANAIFGTSRQVAWLGVLVMVPSTLWLLRAKRRALLAGAAATLAGVFFILGCLVWLKHQPYTTPEQLTASNIPVAYLVNQFVRFSLDVPFLLLPIVVLFLPEVRKSRGRVIAIVCAGFLGYLFLVIYTGGHLRGGFWTLLEPTMGDWVSASGGFGPFLSHGTSPVFLHADTQMLLTILTFGGLLGLITSLIRSYGMAPVTDSAPGASWKEVGVILWPFLVAYVLLLIVRAITTVNSGTPAIIDRYALEMLVVALILLVRYYQERIQPQLPIVSVLLVAIMAIYSVIVTHNMFAFYRARVSIEAELLAAGVPDTSVDNGWEYNINVELQHARSINNRAIVLPADAYVPTPPLPAGTCDMVWYDFYPHIHPLFGISFGPDDCYGPAPFAPVHYSRWPGLTPGTLYVVKYTAPSNPTPVFAHP